MNLTDEEIDKIVAQDILGWLNKGQYHATLESDRSLYRAIANAATNKAICGTIEWLMGKIKQARYEGNTETEDLFIRFLQEYTLFLASQKIDMGLNIKIKGMEIKYEPTRNTTK